MKIHFVNGNALPCGCNANFSDGGGEYSDSITVDLCKEHEESYKKSLEDHVLTGSGKYVKIKSVELSN